MRIGILGTGNVGRTIGSALVAAGHQVMLGSRSADNEKAISWSGTHTPAGSHGSIEAAAAFGDLLFLCINAQGVEALLKQLPPETIQGKTVIDLTNPLDFSQGSPPALLEGYNSRWSMGEAIQQWLPGAKVVKALNTVTAQLMVNASLVNDGNHHLFICGNDAEAKNQVKHLLAENFYWKPEYIIDLGGIKAARLTEAIIPFWVGVMQVEGTPLFNYMIVR